MFVSRHPLWLCVFVALSQQISISAAAGKLHVTVYYEALCPDSVRFFIYQLYPTYRMIGSALDIELIPYGKAIQNRNSNGRWEFDCQHGPAECLGNKVQACILNQTMPSEVKMQILNCMMSDISPSTAGKKCSARSEVRYDPIAKCVNSEFGDDLLAHYGDITHSADPYISFVPTITFNNVYDNSLQNKALRNMLQTSCELIPASSRPSACSQIR